MTIRIVDCRWAAGGEVCWFQWEVSERSASVSCSTDVPTARPPQLGHRRPYRDHRSSNRQPTDAEPLTEARAVDIHRSNGQWPPARRMRLPVVVVGTAWAYSWFYAIITQQRNTTLLLFSCFFYLWGVWRNLFVPVDYVRLSLCMLMYVCCLSRNRTVMRTVLLSVATDAIGDLSISAYLFYPYELRCIRRECI